MSTIVIFGVFAGLFALALRDRRAAVLGCVFLAPWTGLEADIGLSVSAYQLAVLGLLAATVLRALRPGWRVPPIPAGGALMLFAVFAITSSVLQIAFLPDANLSTGALRAPVARAVAQLPLFLLSLVPVALFGWELKRPDDIRAVVRVYLVSLTALAALGWFQLIVWYGTGTNPFPIWVVRLWLGADPESAREGAFGFSQLQIYRMNSLAAEPRQLGSVLAIGMVVIQAVALTLPRVPTVRLAGLWLLFLVSAIATFSTSAVLIWGLGTIVMAAALILFRAPIYRSGGQIAAAVTAVLLFAGTAVAIGEARGVPVIALAAERTIERLDEYGVVEDFDLAILDFLDAKPEAAIVGTGLGNIHLHAAPYILPEFALYSEGNVFTAKQQYLRLISEVGVVGLLLFLGWIAALLLATGRAVRAVPGFGAAAPLGAALVVTLMVNGALAPIFWVMAGTLSALCGIALRRGSGRRAVERNGIEPLTSTMPS